MQGSSSDIDKNIRKQVEAETIPEIKPISVATGYSFCGPIKSQKTQQGPYSPTNKNKLSVDKPIDESANREVMHVDTEGVKRPAPNTKTAMIKRAREG